MLLVEVKELKADLHFHQFLYQAVFYNLRI